VELYLNPVAMADSTSDRVMPPDPAPASAQVNRRTDKSTVPEFGREGSREERAVSLLAGLAAIGWRVRRAQAAACWQALAGEDPPGSRSD
jgi:hypothetical protein